MASLRHLRLLRIDFLSQLPPELVLKILSYVDIADAIRCRAVCRTWNAIVTSFDGYWTKSCAQLGLSANTVELYSTSAGLPGLAAAALKHRHWVVCSTVKAGRFEAKCSNQPISLAKNLGIQNYASGFIGCGFVQCFGPATKQDFFCIKKVCTASKTLQTIGQSTGNQIMVWAKSSPDYILLLTPFGRWIGYCPISQKIVLEWNIVPIRRRSFSSYIHIACCEKCFLVLTASAFSVDSPIWELYILKIGKGESAPVVVAQRTLLLKTQPKERIVQYLLCPSSVAKDEQGFCLLHRLICQSDASVSEYNLDVAKPDVEMIEKTRQVYFPGCECHKINPDSGLPHMISSCISTDHQLFGAIIAPFHFYVWNTQTWQLQTSADLKWLQECGATSSKLLAIGHLYTVIGTRTEGVNLHIVATKTGRVIYNCQKFSSGHPVKLDQINVVNEDWLNDVYCFNSPFFLYLVRENFRDSIISYIQLQSARQKRKRLPFS